MVALGVSSREVVSLWWGWAAYGGVVLVTVVVVDPAFEADASFVFGSEPFRVEELVGEGAVDDPFGFAVCVGPIGPGAAMHDPPLCEHAGEGAGAEVHRRCR